LSHPDLEELLLNQRTIDPKSHTLVRTFYIRFCVFPLPA
jgi:hypothetical protein